MKTISNVESISDLENKIKNKKLLPLSARDIPPNCDKDNVYGEILKLVVYPNKNLSGRIKRYIDLSGKFVIELGSGSGFDSIDMTEEGAVVVGLELSNGRIEYNVELMKEKGINYELLKGDVCYLPFKNGLADVVVCKHLIEHIPDAKRRITEFINLLKGGGILYIDYPNRYSLKQILSDEHYGLPLITIMPKAWAECVVTKFLKYEKTHSTNVFLNPYYFERILKGLGCDYFYVLPDFDLIKNKIRSPNNVSNKLLRIILTLGKIVGINRLLLSFVDKKIFRTLLFPDFVAIVYKCNQK
jgi:2-polyprenyl-3-methyl-5-hydroxy-6-metoxy-1,4-benzoquinol methylase